MGIFTKGQKNIEEVSSPQALPSVSDNGRDIIKSGYTWETSRLHEVYKSEQRAWTVAKVMGAGFVLSCISIMLLMPLKTVVPYVIKVDNSTGMSEILKIANKRDIPASEMMHKYWLSQYVLARETYDWRTLNQEYTKVRELSLPNVFQPYSSQFGTHEDSIEVRLKDNYRILVKLNSIVINSDSIATIRFVKTVFNNKTNTEESSQTWTATIGFEYFPTYEVKEENRLINPFGFKVTSYRVDPEISGVK
ncbi:MULTISPECIES: VirB8/TrbF family protein [unclassified Anaerobiospirillum]|uniref:virB8 family protein n=1 Tax=unclassified Anaerobiospirillum TaxID=2647410 RepID=UPI001FF4AE72|nr:MULTISPECIES: VirB8/TrbF family protein [unclassified Anaerobiospirillum]MCK0525400.1 VirB8/TrbF family protein [Anaerobiospirillum sp. NML120449]MCK0535738.1 VirB8/TrbF family protein [Anaerobiospirillum sp. NML120511]